MAGTTISSAAFNALTADLASGLSTCLLKDGTQTTTARISFLFGVSSTLTTNSTSTTTGSLISSGGLGVANAAWIGGLMNVAGAVTLQSTLTLSSGRMLATFGTANTEVVTLTHSGALDPNGQLITYTGSNPNDATHYFLNCTTSGGGGFIQLRSNGGIGNFQSNNVDLSDERAKIIISDSADHTDFIEALEGKFRKFSYLGATEVGQELDGCTAQDLEELAPELVTEFSDGRKGVFSYRLQQRINSVIPRLIKRINALEDK